ncbi:MAG: 30S ribosomal protein S4 [Sphaerochaetaceae bacterium]|nr:30S ribosomal protein S4 [Sphaerochaetaceae bacterium]
MAIDRTPIRKRSNFVGINPVVLGYEPKKKGREKQFKRRRRKESEYGIQLKEKQKVKFVYGVLEKQFLLTYKKAEKMPGITGENLLRLLESRLDNVVFRSGLAKTRKMARQMISHGHIRVNGSRVNIPSYQVSVGDTISPDTTMTGHLRALRSSYSRSLPPWLSQDSDTLESSVIGTSSRSDIDFDVVESRITELYSK